MTRTISEPACASSMHCRGGRRDVGRVRVRHRLDDDRGAPADLDRPHPDPDGRVAFSPVHDAFNLPDGSPSPRPSPAGRGEKKLGKRRLLGGVEEPRKELVVLGRFVG